MCRVLAASEHLQEPDPEAVDKSAAPATVEHTTVLYLQVPRTYIAVSRDM